MPDPELDDADLREILEGLRSVAVVGASANGSRPSNGVTRYLLRLPGVRVDPVNPNYAEVAGVRCYPSLADLPEPPQVVDVFRRKEALPEVVEAAIDVGAQVVWMQLGVRHEEAARRGREAGLVVVQDRCIMAEHRRLVLGT